MFYFHIIIGLHLHVIQTRVSNTSIVKGDGGYPRSIYAYLSWLPKGKKINLKKNSSLKIKSIKYDMVQMSRIVLELVFLE